MLSYDKHLKKYSRQLRKNMTDAEMALWSKIRGKQLKGYQFYRQKPIGDFIVDFYCPKKNLVIEVDGGQHHSEEEKAKDSHRDKYFQRGNPQKSLKKQIFKRRRRWLRKVVFY